MPKPYKIAELGAPMSCAQFDENIDRLLDRTNHTGSQSCESLNDLEDCVNELEVITQLKQDLEDLQTQVEKINDALSNDGEIADLLSALRTELLNKINDAQADINNLETGAASAQASINSLTANLAALTALVESYNTSQTTNHNSQAAKITLLESQSTNFANAITLLRSDLNNEVAARTNSFSNLSNLIAGKAPIDSPVFTGNPANLSAGGVVATPSDNAGGTEIINAYWFNSRIGPHITNLLNISNIKANINGPTISSPVFIGQPANLNQGGITATPPDSASGVEIINAAWYHGRTGVHLNNLFASINLKADRNSPTFTGVVTCDSNSVLDIKNIAYIATPDLGDNSTRIPNTYWCWSHFTNLNNASVAINNALQTKASITNPSFNGAANFAGYTTLSGGASVATPPGNAGGTEIVNAFWVNAKIANEETARTAADSNLQNQINTLANNGGSTPTNPTPNKVVAFASTYSGMNNVRYNCDAIELTGDSNSRVKFWFPLSIVDVFAKTSYSIIAYISDSVATTLPDSSTEYSTFSIYRVGNVSGSTNENFIEFANKGNYIAIAILKP